MEQSKVFLIPNQDRSWSAMIGREKPSSDAVFFTSEGEYPTEIFYSRNDMNGSGVLCGDECPDRESLLESLNWIGQCGYTVLNLWDYDIEYPWDAKVEAIFNAAYEMRYEKEQIAAAEMFEVVMEDAENPSSEKVSWSFRLDNGLLALVEKNDSSDQQEQASEGNIYDFNIWEPDENGRRGNLYSGGTVTQNDGVHNLSEAVAWVFQHYSRAGLEANKSVFKKSLDDKIQAAEKRSVELNSEKGLGNPDRRTPDLPMK